MEVRGGLWFRRGARLTVAELREIEGFLVKSEGYYPGIDRWWSSKVVPGLVTGERRCMVAFDGSTVAGLVIGKVARPSAKLCSLRVDAAYRGGGVGSRLLASLLAELGRANCGRVHYTIADEVDADSGDFFKRCGFTFLGSCPAKYTRGRDEHVYSATMGAIRQSDTARLWEGLAP